MQDGKAIRRRHARLKYYMLDFCGCGLARVTTSCSHKTLRMRAGSPAGHIRGDDLRIRRPSAIAGGVGVKSVALLRMETPSWTNLMSHAPESPDSLSDQPLNRQVELWMAEHVRGYGGPGRLRKFGFGQSNPTYRLSAASGDYVLRRKPFGKLLPKAHAIEREYRILAALKESDVPVPQARRFEDLPRVAISRCTPGKLIRNGRRFRVSVISMMRQMRIDLKTGNLLGKLARGNIPTLPERLSADHLLHLARDKYAADLPHR